MPSVRKRCRTSAELVWWWVSIDRPVVPWARTNGALQDDRQPQKLDDEDALTAAIIALASKYGRYGYRRITALLRRDGWYVNQFEVTVSEARVSAEERVARIWRREGLRVP